MQKNYVLKLGVLAAACAAVLLSACATTPVDPYALQAIPAAERYCLDAQRVITRTVLPMQLVVHTDYASFVKSKALIEGPTIHQYNWYAPDGAMLGISCKMKSADHLNIEFGAGTAGPDGYCHDMNRQVYALLQAQLTNPRPVVFDASESLEPPGQSTMVGPVWLMPFTLAYDDAAGALHVATKGFVIDYNDPRYQKFPPSWRGTHYCHLIAPDYLSALLSNAVASGAVIGAKAPPLKRD